MEPGGRKILPRMPPSASNNHDAGNDIEPAGQNEEEGARVTVNGKTGQIRFHAKQWRPAYEDAGPKRRKFNLVDSRSGSQILPGVQQLLTVPNAPGSQMVHPSRLVRSAQDGHYYSHGVFIFQAPAPPYGRDFPAELTQDQRPLSFAMIEPELMDIFKHTWYLRQYVRSRRAQGVDGWWDHVMVNDSYGIMNSLQTWSSRFEPGTIHYPASMLYKNVLWLYANRSIQPSMATAGYRQVVEDGLHYLRELEQLLGDSDRSFLLVPIFLLGASAFENRQRGPISRSLAGAANQQAPDGVFHHAMYSLNHIWEMMSDGRSVETWDWERFQDPAMTQNVQDRSLVELLYDPWRPEYHVPRVRSPEAVQDFDHSRFRPAAIGNSAPPPQNAPENMLATRTNSVHTPGLSPSQGVSPHDQGRPPFAPDQSQSQPATFTHERALSQHQFPPVHPRQFIAPPPTGVSSVQENADMLALARSRLVKNRSFQPPCPTCGKELKNPSDAQKHQLQHSKPFHCKEPGCTRNLGFATENDLQRHRKSVHGASPRIGNKIGYVCARCPEPSDGTPRKWWPRLDNFKAHIRRKHHGADEEGLIQASAAPRRPEDTFADPSYHPGSDYHTHGGQYASGPHERREHQLSISSQTADNDSQEAGPSQHHNSQHARQAIENGSEDEDGEEDEDDGDEDGSVGPWELSKSFRSGGNGKRRRSSPLTSPEEGDGEGESPVVKERSGSGSTGSESTPRAGTGGDGAGLGNGTEAEATGMRHVKVEAREAENGDVDRMEVDTDASPPQQNGTRDTNERPGGPGS